MKKMTRNETGKLFSRLRKEDAEFDDLCDARDDVVRVMAHHDIVKEALLLELEKWDLKMHTSFRTKTAKMQKGDRK